jgi:SAM-dependent methyltransferase
MSRNLNSITPKFTKHSKEAYFKFDKEDLRWATPEIVADYRALRLKCKTIVDLGCGVGFQTFSFAKVCEKVYAVEIDERKIAYARENAVALGLHNIEFICGDMLDPAVVSKLGRADVVFCDPERLASEEERMVKSIIPDVDTILNVYGRLTSSIALEFPPQIKKIPFDCEQEYISVDNSLNRLTLYFGDLKKVERSAVLLPSAQRLEMADGILKYSKKLGMYFYEVDPAIVKAGLLGELRQKTGAVCFEQGKAVYFTSDKLVLSPFFKNSFSVVSTFNFNLVEVTKILKEHRFGKVMIRYTIDPQHYWKERSVLERGLKGEKKAHLFRFGKLGVVAEKVCQIFSI